MKRCMLKTILMSLVITNMFMIGNPVKGYADVLNLTYDEALVEIVSIETEIEKIDAEINQISKSIYDINESIESLGIQVKENQEDIDRQSNKVNELSAKVEQQIKNSYINNVSESNIFLQILMTSEGVTDFMHKFMIIQNAVKQNNDELSSYREEKLNLENKQEELNVKVGEIVERKKTLEEQKQNLQLKKSEQKKLLEEVNKKIAEYEASSKNDEVQAISSLEQNTVHNESSSGNGSSIVSYAYNFLGVPYVWGGTTPSGFDCSGFVQYVFRNKGISMPRTTYEQIAGGKAVTGDLQPGDLVFFGSYSSPYHVGIYVGNGQYIHAPRTGDVVKVASLSYRQDYCGARRYI